MGFRVDSPKVGGKTPPDAEPQASLNSGVGSLSHPGTHQGHLHVSAKPENGLSFSIILEPQEW